MEDTKNIPWGSDLTLFTVVDEAFLPGAFALFNSAIMNHFAGRFLVYIVNSDPQWTLPTHPQLEYRRYQHKSGDWHPCVLKALILEDLEPGDYLFLDADIVIERPLDTICEAVKNGIVVSTQDAVMWDPQDVIVMKQCNILGIDFNLPYYPYVNSGFLGLSLPRDATFAKTYSGYCQSILAGHQTYSHPHFPFIEQDILNLIIRKRHADKEPFISIPTRQIDIGATQGNPYQRLEPFRKPSEKESIIKAYNFLIHGAAVERPWLVESKYSSFKRTLRRLGIIPLCRRMRGSLCLYEKSWALYALSSHVSIPVDAWIQHYPEFKGHRSWLWRWAYMG